MDGLPHNTSESPPAPCVRPNALRTSSFQAASFQAACEDSSDAVPQVDFAQAVAQSIDFVTQVFTSEIKQKQLYYHGIEHVQSVARRSLLIFDTVVPFFNGDESSTRGVEFSWPRQRELLRLCAIAHDMIQLFLPQEEPHIPRRRESGLSEFKTFERLHAFMAGCVDEAHSPLFTAADIALVRCAIAATVCKIDPADGGIYQPLLYSQSGSQPALSQAALSQPDFSQPALFPQDFALKDLAQPAFSQLSPFLSLVPRCLALADIGTLGIDGVAAYQKEGSLLLLEENLDIVEFVTDGRTLTDSAQEMLRQRLLKRARFQIVFAKSRLARLESELLGLPEDAISALKQTVFKHLTAETIATIETVTPTSDEISLDELLAFFQLESCLKEIS